MEERRTMYQQVQKRSVVEKRTTQHQFSSSQEGRIPDSPAAMITDGSRTVQRSQEGTSPTFLQERANATASHLRGLLMLPGMGEAKYTAPSMTQATSKSFVTEKKTSTEGEDINCRQTVVARTSVSQQQVSGTPMSPAGFPPNASPPVFVEPFKNARVAGGQTASFHGRLTGNPKPEVSWTRKGAPLKPSGKYAMSYTPASGAVSLQIKNIGPGDEGEYTCTARNQYGEAVCAVFIQTEASFKRSQQDQRAVQQTFQETRRTEQTRITNGTTIEEFRVDTFEYHLLRDSEFRERKLQRGPTEPEEPPSKPLPGPIMPPDLQTKPRASKVLEGSDATFQAKIRGNPKPKVTWFKNGVRILASQRYTITHDEKTQLAVLHIRMALPEDTGHYTMLAENGSGRVVSSAYLAVESYGKEEDAQLRKTQTQPRTPVEAESKSLFDEKDTEGESKALAPKFIWACGDKDIQEGKTARFDVRVSGRPSPDVSWYCNGRQILDDQTHKILVNESGNHALMITVANREDGGQYTCIAKNKSGQAKYEFNVTVVEKELLISPKFVERFSAQTVKEGESLVLTCRAIGTPTPRLSWQKDGVLIQPSPHYIVHSDGGSSTLEIPEVNRSDSAWYQCMAQNSVGSTAIRGRIMVEVVKKKESAPWRLHLPKPQKQIEPEPEPEPEIIYLRHVERSRPHTSRPEEEFRSTEPPKFVIPLQDSTNLTEGSRATFEGKITPIGDPNMVVEWFFNGSPLPASSRINSTYRFGFVTLTILSVTSEDSGVYTCTARNDLGVAESIGNLKCSARERIESVSQHPDALQQIQRLEDYSHYTRSESIDETTIKKPEFVKPLRNLGDLAEGAYAHFEAQLIPVSDPYMKVEWYHNGQFLVASSRISTIFNFGYVALNIRNLRAEDSGTYTIVATNRAGEAVTEATVNVIVKSSIETSSGVAEQQRYVESIEKLEAYRSQAQKTAAEMTEKHVPPRFTVELKNQSGIPEGGVAHFEARLEPVGDSTMRVDWFRDGKPLEASSRTTTFFNFGYIALTIKAIAAHDAGVYTCHAYNAAGEATTSAELSVVTKRDIVHESQHPGGLQKIQHIEDASRYGRKILEEESSVKMAPKFMGPLKGTTRIKEMQNAHFETRLEPQNDSRLTVEWYHNGKPLMQANRIQTYLDFGYVAIDIMSVRVEDSGTYTCVAKNQLGQAEVSVEMVVEARTNIDQTAMHRVDHQRSRHEQEIEREVTEVSKSKPYFVQALKDHPPVREGGNFHLECRIEPLGDPHMRVEWFLNGRPVTVGSRFKTYFDFGYAALDVSGVNVQDAGEYTVRATNTLGSAHCSSMVQVTTSQDILSESITEISQEQLAYLEGGTRYDRTQDDEVPVKTAPVFTRPLHNIETTEGSNIHLECRVQPVGDSSLRTEWMHNGKPIRVGHRFRPSHDFDYVALDILSLYPEDSGIYSCRAINALGEAVTSASVKCVAKRDLIMESQYPESLQQIRHLEDASRYQRREWVEEVMKVQPKFLSPLADVTGLREGGNAHFECRLQPVADPNLKVEWYKDGRPLPAGHRFRPIHDFGYVALDIIDAIPEDTGRYTCRGTNLVGVDEVSAVLEVKGVQKIISETIYQEGMQQIQQLESREMPQRYQPQDEVTTQPPVFTSSPRNVMINEGKPAHFECRLIPVSDPTMKVSWYHNGKPVKSGSRFTERHNFGFVALDIHSAITEDTGTYTCKAINALGEAVTSCSLQVQGKQEIITEALHEGALQQIRQLEDASRYARQEESEEIITQAPVFTHPLRNLELHENQTAHFEGRLIPVGDSKLKVEWFKNSVPLQQGSRVRTLHDFGFVGLDLADVYPEDTGTYTCKATNDLGSATTSAVLVVTAKSSLITDSANEGALTKIRELEDHSRYQRKEEEEVTTTRPPVFTSPLQGQSDLVEAQNAHLECRIEPYPDPTMRVEWFCNGKPLGTGHRFRTMYDFGFAAVDVLSAYPEDSGEYTCKATNRCGTAQSSAKINVRPRGSLIMDSQHPEAMPKLRHLESAKAPAPSLEEAPILQKPEFPRPLRSQENKHESEPLHMEATLTPVNDPNMKVEWFRNGIPIQQGHRFKTQCDFGFVALDVLYAYPEDSGTYMCRARNLNGEAVTSCAVTVKGKEGLLTDTLNQSGLQKIRDLEAPRPARPEEAAPALQRPEFITPLQSLENIGEGKHAHTECRLIPVNDPDLKVEWFVNGVQLRTGSRFRTTHDFGYVALDIMTTYPEDNGTYMCKASNKAGEAVNTCTIQCKGMKSIYLDTQHPEGWSKIQELENVPSRGPLEIQEQPLAPPKFTTPLQGKQTLEEGELAHFECRVEPTHDPKLKIEVYRNEVQLPSGSRYRVTHDFGYVALDLIGVYPEDSGTYKMRAVNDLGEDTTEITMNVVGKDKILSATQHPEGLGKIKELEAQDKFPRPSYEDIKTFQRPVFTHPLQSIDGAEEGQNCHLECRLIPVGDPKLKVEWFRNEVPIAPSSRIHQVHDFGYVSLDISGVRPDDEGVYMCKASNDLGEAVTTASIKIRSKSNIQLESQHPDALPKLRALEPTEGGERPEEVEPVYEKPVFINPLEGPSDLGEGDRVHLAARVIPVGDPTMRIEWYVNGTQLKTGSRIHTTHDFGFVTLDISSVVPEDAGVYMCKAVNRAGEAVTTMSIRVTSKGNILGGVQHPHGQQAWDKIQAKEASLQKEAPAPLDDGVPKIPPTFTTQLVNQDKVPEGQAVHFEATVEPKNDPKLRVEWFKNSVPLTSGSRTRTLFDFGQVVLDVSGARSDDDGIYTCKATNDYGEAVTTAVLKVLSKDWLMGESLHPDAMPKLAELDMAPEKVLSEIPEEDFEKPVFITHLNNQEVKEGQPAHFECKVEPHKDPTLKIEFFVNGTALSNASRFTVKNEFGFVTLDIQHCWPDDAGVYMCKATNKKGEAVTSGSLRVLSEANISLDTQHPMGKAGLEKIQDVEAATLERLQRPEEAAAEEFQKPVWIVPLNPQVISEEGKPLHLEGQFEPKNDPNLKIEWYFNGNILEHAARFRVSDDFGTALLDCTDTYQRDSGIYTCRAKNQHGEAFTSATVVCAAKGSLIEETQHPKGKAGLERIQSLEESLRRTPMPPMAPEDEGKPPKFTSQFQNLDNLSEGEIAHFEATLTPLNDQTMVVEWFYNGQPIKAGHRVRTVYAFGMVVLEILGTNISDSGIYQCRATNKYGKDEISVELKCIERIKGQGPKFTTQIQNLLGLREGDSAHLECNVIPIGDPTMKIEWFHNGQPLRQSTRIKSVSDFGFVVLDIAYVQDHDSGEYVCRATNKYGEDTTKAMITCLGKPGVYSDSLQPDAWIKLKGFDKEVIKPVEVPEKLEPPKFTTQIQDIPQIAEGQSAHFEATLTPTNDPNLVVEWYHNGRKLPTGHRYRTFHDFGIVILDILYCYEQDSGVYEARAVNKLGQDTTTAQITCLSRANLILTSQLPSDMAGGLEKIANLEEAGRLRPTPGAPDVPGQAPVFTVPLENVDDLKEGENTHLEARFTPKDDSKLRVEWYKDDLPLKASSRIRTLCDFGFAILEISPTYPEDSGVYTCRATNFYGEASTSSKVLCSGKRNIILETQLPKGMQEGMGKIAELEGLGQAKPVTPQEEVGGPPVFVTKPADQELPENSLAHFECQLQPANDPTMKVEWYHNGRALSASSRIKTISDFGFIILELKGVYSRDSGVYICKATNRHGEATVTCQLTVKSQQNIDLQPQLPSDFVTGTGAIQELERKLYKNDAPQPMEADETPNPPRFVTEIKDLELTEGAPAHFDCRVEPFGDPTMRIEWFHNTRPLDAGSRIHMIDDFGFVVLDLDWTFPRDSGEYVCVATNKWGQAKTTAKLTCRGKMNVVMESQLPEGMSAEKIKALDEGPDVAKAVSEEPSNEPPKFVEHINNLDIAEGERVIFEARVEPRTDPRLRVEWYFNGKILQTGHRFRTTFDFGYVSLEILYTYSEDSGEYICRAVNDHGEDFSKAAISCKALPSIVLRSQLPKGMKQSEYLTQMEAALKKYTSEIHLTEEDIYDPDKKQPPRFITQIQDHLDLKEMEDSKFECQLAPVGDPNMKVEWFLNGKPLAHKNRFTAIYDFGYVALNLGWVYPQDSGKYVCRATNLYGMDETTAVIEAAGTPGIIYDSQLPKGMESVKRIQEMEAAWQRAPEEPEDIPKAKERPEFVLPPEDFTVLEGDWARFVCRVTGYPRPRVMWLINGHTVMNGTRYKITYDGMWHLDIPKTRQYDHGTVQVIAKNALGEAVSQAQLVVKPTFSDYRAVLKNSPKPWYDYELKDYQRDRMEAELDTKFEERVNHNLSVLHHAEKRTGDHLVTKVYHEPETEWQKEVKRRRTQQEFQVKMKEDDQVVKENRAREGATQYAIPGQQRSLAKDMASSYIKKLDEDKVELTRGPPRRQLSTGGTESVVHGKEVIQQVSKQTQKESKGDLEITRKITATERTEMEHKGKTSEQRVAGNVKPAIPPVFTKKSQPFRCYEKEQAKFEVEFTGEPTPTVQWYREDFPIHNSKDFQIHSFGTKSILLIREVYLEDSGVFAAVAENRGGSAKCSANLVVEERKPRKGATPPSFITTIQDTSVAAGQLARLDARLEGAKPMDVYWLKNGRKLPNDVRFKTIEEQDTYTLLILEAVSQDSGLYECVAINQAGEGRCEARVSVIATPEPTRKAGPPAAKKDVKNQAPMVVENLRELIVQEGQEAKFKCRISGTPNPEIKWLKDDKPIKPSKYFRMATSGDSYSLHISEAFPEDEGIYKCVATNAGGSLSLAAPLKVTAPQAQGKSAQLSPMKDVTVVEGASARFETKISGSPLPAIQWFREGALIPQSRDFQMLQEGNNAVLLIKSTYPEDSGRFTCRATNPAGQAEVSARLTVNRSSGRAYSVPQLKRPLRLPDARLGEPVMLTVDFEADCTLDLSVEWSHDGAKVSPSLVTTRRGRSTLTLNPMTEADVGQYEVKLKNPIGIAASTATLALKDPNDSEKGTAPKILTFSLPPKAEVGEEVLAEAKFTGDPTPTVTWRKNGTVMTGSAVLFSGSAGRVLLSCSVVRPGGFCCPVQWFGREGSAVLFSGSAGRVLLSCSVVRPGGFCCPVQWFGREGSAVLFSGSDLSTLSPPWPPILRGACPRVATAPLTGGFLVSAADWWDRGPAGFVGAP
ncbi:unnamed protein product [Cyprideis torosa]|uniref:Uncharacterized protein n=1 Tax=Cyprideis torosa TaxID=163714 RepID=A0A7R8WA31_9CRUS|nr:unnamed protein product [Cyprideis torosa]CAG0890532.1 unnamed protein product [Cyprideis torosa]